MTFTLFEFVLLAFAVLFLAYVLARILSKGVFRSYFEAKKEFFGNDDKNKNNKGGVEK